MFFDVTRAGVHRPLRVAVAAIAYLDTLPNGCVLHLVGGQSLQVGECASTVEQRAVDALATARRNAVIDTAIDHALDIAAAEANEALGLTPIGSAIALRLGLDAKERVIALSALPATAEEEIGKVPPDLQKSSPQREGVEAEMRVHDVDWTEVLASGGGGSAPPADVAGTTAVAPPAPGPAPAPKKRRRRGQPS